MRCGGVETGHGKGGERAAMKQALEQAWAEAQISVCS